MNKFDIGNWLQHPSVAITPGKGRQLAPEFKSRLLLVRWTRPGGSLETAGQLDAAILSPFGTPAAPQKSFQISKISDFYEFWNIANEGLPYRLTAKLDNPYKFGTQLIIWEFIPLIFDTTMGTVNPPPFQPGAAIDLSPVVNALDNNSGLLAGIQNQQGALLQRLTPGATPQWLEIKVVAFNGTSGDHIFLAQNLERRSVSIAVPAIDAASGQPNVNSILIAVGNDSRPQFDDYDYIVQPGGSIALSADEAAQQIAVWQEIGTNATMCNLSAVST